MSKKSTTSVHMEFILYQIYIHGTVLFARGAHGRSTETQIWQEVRLSFVLEQWATNWPKSFKYKYTFPLKSLLLVFPCFTYALRLLIANERNSLRLS